MSETFGETAGHMVSLAAKLLGWRPGEFWDSTPAELAAALRDPSDISAASGPSRDQIAQMMERDTHE